MLAKLKGYLIAGALFVVAILVALRKAFKAGEASEKADNLEAHLEGGKQQRKAEAESDKALQDKVNEIKSSKPKRGRFTQ